MTKFTVPGLLLDRVRLASLVLIILYSVGAVGFATGEFVPLFQALTPWNLLLSVGLLLYFHRPWKLEMIAWCALAWSVGFGAEWLGVHTGKIFGTYAYQHVLGLRLDEIPLMIGVLWLALAYTSGLVARDILLRTRLRGLLVAEAVLGALLMTALDVLMEPVAIRFEFWTWFGVSPPLQNYLAWFVIAFALIAVFRYLLPRAHNPLARVFLGCQYGFFGVLFLLS